MEHDARTPGHAADDVNHQHEMALSMLEQRTALLLERCRNVSSRLTDAQAAAAELGLVELCGVLWASGRPALALALQAAGLKELGARTRFANALHARTGPCAAPSASWQPPSSGSGGGRRACRIDNGQFRRIGSGGACGILRGTCRKMGLRRNRGH